MPTVPHTGDMNTSHLALLLGVGVRVVGPDADGGYRVTAEATEEQINTALAAMDPAYVDPVSVAAQQAAATAATNKTTLEQRADAALVDLRAYIDLPTPTAGQTTAAVKLLCRVAVGLIRLVLRRFDSPD